MKVIYAQKYDPIEGSTIFLAGPTPRAEVVQSWRPEALKMLESLGFEGTVFVPEMEDGFNRDFEYSSQIEWEEKSLNRADVIVFWVPRELKTMPAFTTNVEFGMWITKAPEKVVFGAPDWSVKNEYLKYYAKKLKIPNSNTLYDTIKSALRIIND